MATSKTTDTLTAIASVVVASVAQTNSPDKSPKTNETKPAPWQAPQLVAASDEELDEIPW